MRITYRLFKLLKEKYGLNEKVWSPFGILGLTQSILMVRAVEHAAKKVGGANLSGQAIYDAMFEGPITEDELMGILPTLYYTKEAPFSTRDMKVKITTVKDKCQLAVPDGSPCHSEWST